MTDASVTGIRCGPWRRCTALCNPRGVAGALAWADGALLCTFDTRGLTPEIVTDVTWTHPELVLNGAARPSPERAPVRLLGRSPAERSLHRPLLWPVAGTAAV
jgi:hypothetical protein